MKERTPGIEWARMMCSGDGPTIDPDALAIYVCHSKAGKAMQARQALQELILGREPRKVFPSWIDSLCRVLGGPGWVANPMGCPFDLVGGFLEQWRPNKPPRRLDLWEYQIALLKHAPKIAPAAQETAP